MDSSNSKRIRNKNWSVEEKNLLQRLISKSLPIIENKSTKSFVNHAKINEWRSITKQFNRMLDKTEFEKRSMRELKMAWRRMKYLSKETKDNSHKQQSQGKDGGQSFSISDAPFEFAVNINYDDSNEGVTKIDRSPSPYQQEIKLSPSDLKMYEQNSSQSTDTTEDVPDDSAIKDTKAIKNSYNNMMNNFIKSVVNSNEDFKKRHMAILEKEHEYNIEIAKLKVKKLELQIALLTKEMNMKANGTM